MISPIAQIFRLAVVTAVVCSAFARESYEIKGTAEQTVFVPGGELRHTISHTFRIQLETNVWSIVTTSSNSDADWEGLGTDATDLFYLRSLKENAEKIKATGRDVINSATGSIENGPVPQRCSTVHSILWYAFCSGDYLKSNPESLIEEFFSRSRHASELVNRGELKLPATFSFIPNSLPLVRTLDLLAAEGQNAATNWSYRVHAVTNYNSLNWPLTSEFTINDGARVIQKWSFNFNSVSENLRPIRLPETTGIYLVSDFRYQNPRIPSLALEYFSTNRWLSTVEIHALMLTPRTAKPLIK